MKRITRKLPEHQLAFKLDTGDTITVSVTRRYKDQWACLDVQTVVTTTDGVEHVLERHTDTIQMAALAASPNAADERIAHAYADAEGRALDYLAAARVFLDLPETPDDPTGGRA